MRRDTNKSSNFLASLKADEPPLCRFQHSRKTKLSYERWKQNMRTLKSLLEGGDGFVGEFCGKHLQNKHAFLWALSVYSLHCRFMSIRWTWLYFRSRLIRHTFVFKFKSSPEDQLPLRKRTRGAICSSIFSCYVTGTTVNCDLQFRGDDKSVGKIVKLRN